MNGPSNRTIAAAATIAILTLVAAVFSQHPAMVTGTITGGFIGMFVVGFYFLPAIIAKGRNHHNTIAIFATNILLGWTCLGWIIALIWSLTAVKEI